MMKKILYLILLFLPLNLFSIQNKFNYITPENGLSQGNITFVYQDKQGYIWIGTFSGLNRFDGYKCKVFNFNPDDTSSLSHERVTRICEDTEHRFWIGTFGGGVSVYLPEEGIFHRIRQVKTNERVYTLGTINGITLDKDGNIWVLDETAGLFVFDNNFNCIKSFHSSDDPTSLPRTSFFSCEIDAEGSCWVGAGNGTLCKLPKDGNKFERIVFENRVAAVDDAIRTMYIDKFGKFWIGTTSQGAYCFDPETKTTVNYRKEDPVNTLTANTVMAFCDDWDGNMLIGLDGGGLNILDRNTGKISVIKYEPGNPESISTNAIYAIFIDRSETLWIGTYAGGVNYQGRYRYKFRNYAPNPANPNSLSYKNVKCILQDSDGDIWLGTDGGGLNLFNQAAGTFKHYRANPDNPKWLQTDVIIYMMQDKDGDIYLGSYAHGLTIFNKQTETFKQFLPDDTDPNSIAGLHPWYIFQDSYGLIWVGMLGVGLNVFDKASQTFRHYRANAADLSALSNPNMKVIYEDSDHTLWIGTEGGGLHRYNREQDNFSRFMFDPNIKGTISNNDVRAIYQDSKGNLWIGTSNGLNLMHIDSSIISFETITTKEGLPNNVINDILEDNEGYLWISTNHGISKFDPSTRSFRNYDITDGLQGNEYNYTAAIKTTSGEFFFGGKNGFNVFRPEEISDNPHKPAIVLTDFQIFNKSVDKVKVRLHGEKRFVSISQVKQIKLTHKENVIGFEFSVLDYGNPVKNKYWYMLEGFDKDWNEISSVKRYASYTNLKGGRYTFKVKGANSDGLMSEKDLSIKLIVKPPFWKTAWFIILVILIAGVIVYRYIQEKREATLRDKAILEEKIREGTVELEKQKKEVVLKDKALQEKIESEKEQNWFNIGMNKMNEVMSLNKDDLFKFSQSIITHIAEYVEVSQGAIYLINDEKEDDQYLELMAAYAPDDKRLNGARFEIEEGQLGVCFKEQRIIRVNNLPEGYAYLQSGLGDAPLKYLAVIPLRLNEITIGVIELLSFNEIPQYRVDFVEKSGETLTSILTSLKANEKTKKLLESQKMLSEEMAAQEEELRQNLEEMQATQEELGRMKEIEMVKDDERRQAEQKLMDQLKEQNQVLVDKQSALQKEEYLFKAILDNATEHIYFKDKDSKFIRLSLSMLDLFKKKNLSELLGKSDFDFFDDEHARPAFEGEQEIIRTGIPIIDLIEKEVHKDGSISWVNTSKMPLKDQEGNIVGTWGISKDITTTKELEESVIQNRDKSLLCESVFETIINEMSGQVFVIDEKGIIYVTNQAFAKAHGIKMSEIQGKVLMDILDDAEKKSMKSNISQAKKKGAVSWTEESKRGKEKVVLNKQLVKVIIEENHSEYYLYIENS